MASTREVRAGKAFIELGMRANLDRGIRQAQAKLNAFSKSVAALGTKLSAIGGAIVTPLLGATTHFAKVGDTIDKMSKRTGIATGELQALGFAAEQNGASLGDIETAARGLGTFLKQLDQGSSRATKVLAQLKLTPDDLAGKSTTERLAIIGEALANLPDPDLRFGIATQLQMQQLLPLLMQGGQGIRDLVDEAERLGIILDPEQIKAAAEYTDAMNRVKRSIGGVVNQVGAALAPLLTELFGKMQKAIRPVIDWVKRNKEVVIVALKVGAAIAATGAALLGVALLIKAASMALGVFTLVGKLAGAAMLIFKGILLGVTLAIAAVKAALLILLSPFTLIAAALAAVVAGFLDWSKAGKKAADTIKGAFGGLGPTVRDTIGGIVDAIKSGDIGLAAKIAMTGLKLAFAQAKRAILPIWASIVKAIGPPFFAVFGAIQKTINRLRQGFMLLKNLVTGLLLEIERASKLDEIDERVKKLKKQQSDILRQAAPLQMREQFDSLRAAGFGEQVVETVVNYKGLGLDKLRSQLGEMGLDEAEIKRAVTLKIHGGDIAAARDQLAAAGLSDEQIEKVIAAQNVPDMRDQLAAAGLSDEQIEKAIEVRADLPDFAAMGFTGDEIGALVTTQVSQAQLAGGMTKEEREQLADARRRVSEINKEIERAVNPAKTLQQESDRIFDNFAKINEEANQRSQQIDQEIAAKIAALETVGDEESIRELEAEIAGLKQELAGNRKKAADKAGAPAESEQEIYVPGLGLAMDMIGRGVDAAIAAGQQFTSPSTGTFSGLAAAFLQQSGGPQDRIAKATERGAKAAEDLVAIANREGPLVIS